MKTNMTFEEAVAIMENVLHAWMRPGSSADCVLRAFGLRLPDTVNAIKAASKTLTELRTIVDALPRCWRLTEEGQLVRDVPVVEGFVGPQTVFMRRGDNPTPLELSSGLIANKTVWDICCATREAAIALHERKERDNAT
jgi:hypothetical protein